MPLQKQTASTHPKEIANCEITLDWLIGIAVIGLVSMMPAGVCAQVGKCPLSSHVVSGQAKARLDARPVWYTFTGRNDTFFGEKSILWRAVHGLAGNWRVTRQVRRPIGGTVG